MKRIIIVIACFLFCWIVVTPIVQRALGYFPGTPGWQVAEIAASQGDVHLCDRIVGLPWQIFSMGPSIAESQFLCVYEYAKRTKDPSACELLMPSSYGLSCVGGAKSEPDLCNMSNGEVRWKDGSETYTSCANVTKKRTKDGNACCLIARVAFVKSENDCSSLKDDSAMLDECLQNLAFKNHDSVVCAGIANTNTKSACTVNAEAIRKNPSICSGCKARVETLDQLK